MTTATYAVRASLLSASLLALAACGSGAADPAGRAPAPEPDFTLSGQDPPLRVPSGAVIEVHTPRASEGQVGPGATADDVWSVAPTPPLSGPIFVEGAHPGDLLAVTLHRIDVEDWGWAAVVPGLGALPADFSQPFLKTFGLSAGATEARFDDRIRIPLRPFAAVMQVAAPGDGDGHGGRLSDRHLVEGVTAYFPVSVEGALLSLGGVRAAQGDGGVAGVGLEAAARLIVGVRVIEGEWALAEPHYESDASYAVTASGATLDEAAEKATRYMVDYLTKEHRLTRAEAYLLTSLAADLKVSQFGRPLGARVSLHISRSALPGG